MVTGQTDQTITLKDGQVHSKPDSCNPEGKHALQIHLCEGKVYNPDDLYGSFDHDSDGFH